MVQRKSKKGVREKSNLCTTEKNGIKPEIEVKFLISTCFFYKNNFIRTTRLKFGQKLRTT